jgi:KDO2-lipid IV(A) lauroyltransferase
MALLVEIIARLVAALPRGAALRLGRFGGWIACHVIRHRRKLLVQTLAECLPEKSESERHRIATRMYLHLGMTFVDQLRILVSGLDEFHALIEVQNREHIENAASDSSGTLLLTAHLGNWELSGFITTLTDCPYAVVVKNFRNAAVDRFITQSRERMGATTLSAKTSFKECVRRLKRGEFMFMILDQNMIADEGIFVDFFGKPACTTPGLALLSAYTQSTVYPVFMMRRPDYGYTMTIQPPIAPPPDKSKESLLEYTQTYTTIIEEMIRKHPEQWIWLHKRWRTKPPAEG